MKRGYEWSIGLALLLVLGGLSIPDGAAGQGETDEPEGLVLFTETHKCNMCHGVPAAGIEAKTKSEAMKGGDLGGKIETEFEEIAAYVRKEGELDGKTHKKQFKGTDEELQAIIDWLATLEAQE